MNIDTSSIGSSNCDLSMPILSVSQSVMTGFKYDIGYGPSLSQSFNLSGIHMLDYPSSITVTSPMNYEVSLNSDTGFTSNLNIPFTTDSLPSMPVFVRLKAGLMPNVYDNQIISVLGGRADTVNIVCNGSVIIPPTIILNTDSLFGFEYDFSAGPSTVQSYSLSGSNLASFPSYITVVAPLSYEVSLNANTGFGIAINIPYLHATLMQTLIYVRLKEGLTLGAYNEGITHACSGAQTKYVLCSGSVNLPEYISNNSKKCSFNISPNPTSEFLNCTFETSINRKFSIVNALGKIVKHWESNNQKETIDVKNFSNGIYFLKVEEDNRNYSQKFIIRRD